MAVYTQVSAESLDAFLRRYDDVGDLVSAKGIADRCVWIPGGPSASVTHSNTGPSANRSGSSARSNRARMRTVPLAVAISTHAPSSMPRATAVSGLMATSGSGARRRSDGTW